MIKGQYTRPTSKPAKVLLHCPCCNRKYKKESTLHKHMNSEHYYETRKSNYYSLDFITRQKILESAINYVQILDKVKDLSDTEVLIDSTSISSAVKLLPQMEIVPEDEQRRMCIAQRTFAQRLFSTSFFSEIKEKMNECLNNLETFFRMGVPYNDTNFCPTLVIDFFWHATMQDSSLYAEICNRSVGFIIPHCTDRDPTEDEQRYQYFLDVFTKRYRSLVAVEVFDKIQPIDVSTVVASFRHWIEEYEKLRQKEIENHNLMIAKREAYEASRFFEEPAVYRSLRSSC